MQSLLRHIAACNNAVLPGARLAFCLGPQQVGWVKPDLAGALRGMAGITRHGNAVVLADPADLPAIARAAAGLGFGRVRTEMFDVRATPSGPVLTTIDRGALPAFGIAAQGVHLDGLVRRPDGLHIWIGKRAANKALDPGKFDHIVAGGISSGMSAWDTLIKEAGEEAAMPQALLASARQHATLSYALDRPEGLRRDVLHCYEVELPADFVPQPADGEVEHFTLWPLRDVLTAVRTTDDFKFNVNLVLTALFLRHGLLEDGEAARLHTAFAAHSYQPKACHRG